MDRIRGRLLTGTALVLALLAALAHAGGSPETTLLVVNARSPLSMQVANEYIRIRDLPARQVIWLDEVPSGDTISVERFRNSVLAPIREHIAEQALSGEIDLIAYSAGFPYAVNFRRDERAHGMAQNKHRGHAGSLTGMSFFARQVEAGEVAYLSANANPYFRRPLVHRVSDGGAGSEVRFDVSRGFRYRYNWARNMMAAAEAHEGFFLSVMLGYTGFRGNSVPEIIDYLARAAGSDATHPAGTVYLMENNDIRTRARRPMFEPLRQSMQARGRKVEVLKQGAAGQNGRVPQGKQDVIGVVVGTRTFDWKGSGSRMLPGAIAESFTSYGGHFTHAPQTKLTEFLRHGAAGSSGAVREPYSFVQKFPVPQMHAFYADGSSLAEAFFQSVASPYQLLVVGEPLARPFAHFANLSLASPSANQPWRGEVAIRANVAPAPGRAVRHVELWVNGRLHGSAAPGDSIALDTLRLADGVNELRLVAVEDSAIETRSYVREWIRVDNRGRSVDVTDSPESARLSDAVVLSGRADGAGRVQVRHASRVVAEASVSNGRWRAEVAAARLGMGPVTLHVSAEYADGGTARSAPVRMRVGAPPLLPAERRPPGTEPGVSLKVARASGASELLKAEGLTGRMPREARGGLNEVKASGYVKVRESGLYEVTVQASGSFELAVGQQWRESVDFREHQGDKRFFIPLEAGWHRFGLALWHLESDRVRVFMGGPEPAFRLAGERVRTVSD